MTFRVAVRLSMGMKRNNVLKYLMDLDVTKHVFWVSDKGDSYQSPQLQTSRKIEFSLVAS